MPSFREKIIYKINNRKHIYDYMIYYTYNTYGMCVTSTAHTTLPLPRGRGVVTVVSADE